MTGMLFFNAHNFIRVGPRGHGVETPVMEKLEVPLGIGGIKFRLDKLRLN